MKKFVIRATLGFAIIFVGLFLLLCVEHFRGTSALRSHLQELASRGEKLSISDNLPPQVPPDENAATDLFALTNEVQELSRIATSAPPAMKIVAPGRAIAAWQLSSWAVSDKESNTWKRFKTEIQPAQATLEKLKGIWNKPGCDDGFNYSNSFIDYSSPSLLMVPKQLAQLFSAEATTELQANNLPDVVDPIHSLLAVARTMDDQRQLISQLVRIACIRIAYSATWAALQKPGWTEEQLVQLQSAWQLNDLPQAMIKAFEMERAMTLVYFDQVRSSKAKRDKAIGAQEAFTTFIGAENSLPSHGFLLDYIHVPIWRFAWAAQDELNALARYQKVISASRIAASKSWSEAEPLFPLPALDDSPFSVTIVGGNQEKLGWYDRCRYLFSRDTLSIFSGNLMLKSLKAQTEQNMVLTTIALKRYEIRHGKPPNSLVDLVPEFLRAIPIDLMDGKPLRYHLENDTGYKLYSVGTDGKDDGGNPNLQYLDTLASDPWNGKDMVWHSLATEAEVIDH